MSKSNTKSSSDAQQSNEKSNSGIVITGGLDTAKQNNESPEQTADESEIEAEATEATAEAEAEPSVEVEEEIVDVDDADEEPAAEDDSEASDAVETDETPEEDSTDDSDAEPDEAAETVEEEVETPEAEADENEEEAEASTVDEETPEGLDADDEQPTSDTRVDNAEAAEPEVTDVKEEDQGAAEAADTEETADADAEEMDVHEVSHPPQRLNATIVAKELKNHLNNISVLVEECKIRTSPKGMAIRAVDPANVGMVDAMLDAEAFEGFDTDYGVLGVSLDRLEDVVALAGAKDLITFEYDTQTRKLHIKIDGIEYTLALIDPDSIRQEPDIPDLPLPCEVKVDSGEIDRAVKAADMVSDHIGFRTVQQPGDDQLVIEAEGDTDDVDLTLHESDLVSTSITDEVTSLFSLEYLKDINKALPSKTVVTIELGNEFPIKLRFNNEDGTRDVEYMLAPRINSD